MRNPSIVDLREPLRRQKCSQDKAFTYAFVGRRSRPFTLRLQLLRQPLPLLGLPLLRPLLLLLRRRLRLLQPLLLRLRLPRLGLRLMQLLLLRLLPPLLRLQLLLWQQLLQRSECGMLRGLLRLRLLRMLMLILSRVGTQGLSIFPRRVGAGVGSRSHRFAFAAGGSASDEHEPPEGGECFLGGGRSFSEEGQSSFGGGRSCLGGG